MRMKIAGLYKHTVIVIVRQKHSRNGTFVQRNCRIWGISRSSFFFPPPPSISRCYRAGDGMASGRQPLDLQTAGPCLLTCLLLALSHFDNSRCSVVSTEYSSVHYKVIISVKVSNSKTETFTREEKQRLWTIPSIRLFLWDCKYAFFY